MSTPHRTPHRYIPTIDTSVARQGSRTFATYGGLETPLSAQERRRPSLTFSAFSEPSPVSLPTTPGQKLHSSGDNASFFYADDALMRMNCIKTEPISRPLQHSAMTTFDYLPGSEMNVQAPVSLSPVCDSFSGSFVSSAASTNSWHAVSEPQMTHLDQPMLFRTPSLNTSSSFSDTAPLTKSMYSDGFQHLQTGGMPQCVPAQFDQQFFNTQLVTPTDVHDHEMLYAQHMHSGMTSPMDHSTLHSGSFDSSYSVLSPWSQEESSPMLEQPMSESFMMLRAKDEDLQDLDMPQAFAQQDTPKRSRYKHKPASLHKRSRTGSLQYVTSRYDVHLSIDTKGVEYNAEAGRYQKKNVSPETKRWKCSVPGCHSLSARKEHLRRHELSHQPEKQFHCKLPKCGRAITRSDNLIQHLMTHARPPKPGKRNNHHSREKIEEMVRKTMLDEKLAERTVTNLRKAIDREQDKWSCSDSSARDWSSHDANDDTARLHYDS